MDLDMLRLAGELVTSHFVTFLFGGAVALALAIRRCPDCRRHKNGKHWG